MARKRIRTKLARYNPVNVKTLRAQMLKCPNPIYGQMVSEGQMSDGDMMDFALSLANSYFSGQLLESFKATALAHRELQTRRAVLVTAAIFGATATFDEEGGMSLKAIFPKNGPDLITFAVQQLVDTGMSVADAMQRIEKPAPAQRDMAETIRRQLPELEKLSTSNMH